MYNFENKEMCRLENLLLEKGYRVIAGIDEAGRGSLAGPVVAACVVLNPENIPHGVADSKKLTGKRRSELYDSILSTAIGFGIGVVSHEVIDEVNILNATKLAMKRAILSVVPFPDFLLIDAVKLYDISISSISLVKGESKSVSIAAASILAKVYRDRLLNDLSKKYPMYGFETHKGYATENHRQALEEYGPCEIHRLSYKPVFEALKKWKSKNRR